MQELVAKGSPFYIVSWFINNQLMENSELYYKHFLRKIYTYQFFDDLIFIMPLYVVMFQDFWMASYQVSILLWAMAITSLLLEVPTWVLADKYSRKGILIIWQFMQMASFLVWIYFKSFRWFLIGIVIRWIAYSLNSGTAQAFLYDEMKEYWKEKDYSSILGKLTWASVIWLWVSSLIAMVKQFVTYDTLLRMWIGSLLVSAWALAAIRNVRQKKWISDHNYITTLKKWLKYSWGHAVIFKILLFTMIFSWTTWLLIEYFPSYINQVGVPDFFFWLFFAAFAVVGTIASLFAHKIQHIQKIPLMIATWVLWFALIVIGRQVNFIGIGIAIAAGLFVFSIKIMFESEMQHQTPSQFRATVWSVYGFWMQAMIILWHVLFGFVALGDLYNRGYIFYGFVLSLLWLFGLYLFWSKEWKDDPVPQELI